MEQYVDVFSDKWTKRLKAFAWIRFSLHVLFLICWCILLITLCEGLSPYITGKEEWTEMPFTLSQLEAIFVLLAMCWFMKHTMRGIKW